MNAGTPTWKVMAAMDAEKRDHGGGAARTDRSPEAAREAATIVIERLQGAGHVAYFAGGCVRDRLLNLAVTDYDIATSALPEQVGERFHHTHFVGEAFGVMLVRCRGFSIQVATFRTDGEYLDHRHPDHVEFSDAQHDALRRDFTINGLFEDPLKDEVIDFVGGVDDLNARLIRAIGDPAARVAEDHLRMLRAIRFAARFGFAIEEATADTIRSEAQHLAGVSRERIGIEVRKMMAHPNRGVAAWELQYLGLDEAALGAPRPAPAPPRVGRLPDDAPATTALAAWLLDRHLGATPGTLSIRRREKLDEAARRWGKMLVLSNQELHELRETVALYGLLLSDWPRLGVARQKRLAVKPGFREAQLVLQTIDRPAFVDVRRRVQHLAETGLAPDPFVTGDDLIKAGFPPGPTFAYLLDAIYDAQLEGAVKSSQEALRLAHQLEPGAAGSG